MARSESKSMQVLPKDENFFIKKAELFGWELLGSQEINVKESHVEDRGDAMYSVITSENYVKLTFKRDREIKNYDKIVEIENEYWDLLALTLEPVILLPFRNKIASLIVIALLLFLFVQGGFLIALSVLGFAGWGYLVYKRFKDKKEASIIVPQLEEKVDKLF